MAENPPRLQLPPLPDPQSHEELRDWALTLVAVLDEALVSVNDSVQELSRRIATLEDAP